MNSGAINRVWAVLALLVALCGSAPALAQQEGAATVAPTGQPAAGRVSMVLGGAWLESPGAAGSVGGGAESRRVELGMEVRAGDFVRTEPNGHVHIRFIDNALVSVRPDSRLEIERYEYDRRNPALSTVKFSLEEGVTRSISGAAASSARQRFRLNTPIAAIGVRGTDFVVSATRDSVRALVNEGTIVLAPYSVECVAEALGPCAANALELSGATDQMLGFDLGAAEPRVLPAVHETNSNGLREDVNSAVEEAVANEDEITDSNEAYLEGTANDRVNTGLANLAAVSAPVPPPAAPPPEPDFTPKVPFGTEQNDGRQMAWGRWGAGKGELERITYAYSEASENREVSIGNFEYALFRPELGSRNVNSGLGTVEFDLAAAQAFLDSGGNTVAMQVRDGELAIDFDRNLFSTGLTLDHDLVGTVRFSADGRVFDGGFFRMNNASQKVSGAVTLDGQEAGYYFRQQLDVGDISGLTLWDSR